VVIPLVLVAVLVALNLYRSGLALTPEKLQAARERWQKAGCENYDISVTTTGPARGWYHVKVRHGRVHEATYDNGASLTGQQGYAWTVPGLFDVLQQELAFAAEPDAPDTYTEVEFDPEDGRLVRYLRRTPGLTVETKVVEFVKK
jgi:hypothetical protein